MSLPKQLPVYFDVTAGSAVEPASGSMQGFTAGPVTCYRDVGGRRMEAAV